MGEEIKICNIKNKICEPDLLFYYGEEFGILFEVKSFLPEIKDITKNGKIYNKFVNTLIKKEKYFEKMKDFSKHEVIFVVHGDDEYKFRKMVFPPKNREELSFFLRSKFNFQLWTWDIREDRSTSQGLRIKPAIGKSNCKKIRMPYLSTRDYLDFIQMKNKKRFIRSKPEIEYTMAYILLSVPGLIYKEIESNMLDRAEDQWQTAKEIHHLVLEDKVGLEDYLPKSQWIEEALSRLTEIYMIEKKDNKYRIPLSRRYVRETLYEIFAEKEVKLKYGILRKRSVSRKRKEIKRIYIPNSTYNMILNIVQSTYEEGGVIEKENLKKKRKSKDVHQEKNSAWALGFIEERKEKIIITDLGTEFAESEDYRRRTIFHNQALEKIPLYRIIFEKLKGKSSLTKKEIEEEIQTKRKEKYKKSSLNAISGAIVNWLKNTGYCKHEEGIYLYQEPNSLKQLKLKDLNSS